MTRSNENHIAVPPGATIKEMLEDRGMTQVEFSLRTGVSQKHISHLIHGDVHLTEAMAFRLEMVLGPPARFFLNLEFIYREKLGRIAYEEELKEDLKKLSSYPYSRMVDLGCVPECDSPKERLVNLRKFFGVASLKVLEDEKYEKFSVKLLSPVEKKSKMLDILLEQARKEARRLSPKAISATRVRRLLKEYDRRFSLESEISFYTLREELAHYGLAVVILPLFEEIGKNCICFLDGKKAVLAVDEKWVHDTNFWKDFHMEIRDWILPSIL